MDKQTQYAYNEWLLLYGYRPVTFEEVTASGIVERNKGLRWRSIVTFIFDNEQDTQIFSLIKRKESK